MHTQTIPVGPTASRREVQIATATPSDEQRKTFTRHEPVPGIVLWTSPDIPQDFIDTFFDGLQTFAQAHPPGPISDEYEADAWLRYAQTGDVTKIDAVAKVLITTSPNSKQSEWHAVKVGNLLAFCSPDCVGPEIGQVIGAYRAIEAAGQVCQDITLRGHPTHALTTRSTRRRR